MIVAIVAIASGVAGFLVGRITGIISGVLSEHGDNNRSED